ncbi:hypothetical protein L6164_036164 [Bauhinia variegata]|uniref:Uncharacterized protein n=1 Tax=Bauhinia variegata TaxID=167791 RepID=A0ACB9KGE8_BAUVA|nr:hypothetical protein L6164_036164 [Bauhinia variegata]
MKRKRGHKKGKTKGTPAIPSNDTHRNAEGQNEAEMSGGDEYGDDKYESRMEVDTPSSTGTDQHYNLANINPDGSIDKAAGKSVGRVKVKLRTPKMLDSQSQPTSSDAPTQSDTDKSSQQQGFEKQGASTERMEDSANSLSETKLGVPSKRASSIKIKSSKVLGSNTCKSLPASIESTYRKETKTPQQNPRYNKQELDTALAVIRKVMKMDAAEPFNVPVNPEALGIPDYFDVIDTPMDFGTICSNLERNNKYLNSEDVFKDVQYIWHNCYKYNNKGDYILDLMRRVKKNFMKYWTAAGLFSEQSKGGDRAEDGGLSGEGKVVKGGQLKQKTKKRHGRRHKHDCLCAICVLKRRRKEREENARIAKGNVGFGGDKLAKEYKQEESMLLESPDGEDSSSNMDGSLDPDVDAEDEEKGEEVKLEEVSQKQYSSSEVNREDVDDDNDLEEGDEEEDGEEEDDEEKGETPDRSQPNGALVEKSSAGEETLDEYMMTQQDAFLEQQEKKESQDKREKAKLLESLYVENPQLSSLCGILFPRKSDSVWNGSHSLNPRHNPARSSSIHVAIQTFMK